MVNIAEEVDESVQFPRAVQGRKEAREGQFRDCILRRAAQGP